MTGARVQWTRPRVNGVRTRVSRYARAPRELASGHCPNFNRAHQRRGTMFALAFGHGEHADDPQGWAAPRAADEPRQASDLTPSEQASLRLALLFLRTRLNGTAKLARALKVSRQTLTCYLGKNGRPSAAVAIRAARIAGVDVQFLLDLRFPPEGACPYCGRGRAAIRAIYCRLSA